MIHSIHRDDLLRKLQSTTKPILIEVSSGETFTRSHLPGAIQMNLSEITWDFQDRFPDRDCEIILYGITAQSFDSQQAANLMRVLGYKKVSVYHEGKDDWMEAGYPLDSDQETSEYRAA